MTKQEATSKKKNRKYVKDVEQVELEKVEPIVEPEPETKPADDSMLPKKSLFRIDEVATYFSVSEQCIRTWIAHGHLKKENIVGIARISRQSILDCRFNKKKG